MKNNTIYEYKNTNGNTNTNMNTHTNTHTNQQPTYYYNDNLNNIRRFTNYNKKLD